MRRPKIHFTPTRGWLNDPNGTVRIDGIYHLFYQANPNDIQPKDMSWGHATSRDLIHWEHHDLAIACTDKGQAFSGSCFLDRENRSGLGSTQSPPLLAFYTRNRKDGLEEQYLSYSTDYEHFTEVERPVVPNPEPAFFPDFRDPKVFENPRGGYSMVLAAGRTLLFYASDNFLDWHRTGEFDPSAFGFAGITECPDCFPLILEDKTRYVLSVSMILDEDKVCEDYDLLDREYCRQKVMQYFVGQFDGERFTDTQLWSEPLILDHGKDAYALTTFNHYHKAPESQIAIAWAQNWEDATDVPTISGIARGKMTLARRLSLKHTALGIRLAQKPVVSGEYRLFRHAAMNEAETFNPMVPMLFHIEAEEEADIRICNSLDEEVLIEVTEDEIRVDTRYASSMQFGLIKENLSKELHVAKRALKGTCDVDLIYDEGVLEVYADEGTAVFTLNVYPNIPYTQLVVLPK